MSFITGNEIFMIPLFGILIFFAFYLSTDRVLEYFSKQSQNTKDEVLELMKKMFIETNPKKVSTLLLLSSFGLGFLVFLLFWPSFVAGLIFGLVFVFAGWKIPKMIMKTLWERRCDRFTDQMVDGMTIMANGIKAGLSITQSMERVVENIKGPISQEFALVLNKIQLGMTVEDALSELGERVPRQDVQMFVTSVNILKETGGNLAETFQTIVTVVRERQKIEKKVQALTAQGSMQAIIITLVPFILFVVFYFVDPAYVMPLITKPLGWFLLVVMLGLQVLGGFLMKKIVTIKV